MLLKQMSMIVRWIMICCVGFVSPLHVMNLGLDLVDASVVDRCFVFGVAQGEAYGG